MKEYFIYKKFIDKMVENQNNTSISCLQDIYSYNDYDILLRPVLDIIRENKNQSLTSIRLKLFLRSGLKEIIDLFVNETKITPGLILDFGTFKTRDTVICGNRSEVDFENGYLVSKKIPMEMDTIFDLASTSKIFTAVAVLKLEEVGLIDVFDPVKKYVPEFKKLGDTTIYDLLKFRVKVVTDKRVDSAKTSDDALNILYTLHPVEKELNENSYTDMGAMALRIVVERVTRMQFTSFINTAILRMIGMKDTALREPNYNKHRIANENFSTIVTKEGFGITRYDNYPGTPHDKKAIAIGELQGIAPGHAGYFSTNDDVKVFLIMLKSGGTGLNLTSADVVIHLDLWWNPQAENQATDRAHRIGQKNTVEVIHLITKGTIEEKILELQNKKRVLSDKLIDGEKRDQNILANLTESDIKHLLSYENKD